MARSSTTKKRRGPEPIRQWLERKCGFYRRHIEVRQLATAEEIAEVWPRNKKASLIQWVKTYGDCRVWVARQDGDSSVVDAAEERMLDALNEEPRQVRLPASADTVQVYPKSLRSLLWFRSHDWLAGWIAARTTAIREAADDGTLERDDLGEPITILQRAELELAAQLSQMAAVACYPGSGIPPEAEDSAEVSEWPGPEWDELDPLDLYAIHTAFVEVNAGRMEALERIVKPQRGAGSNERMSWNVFAGTLAMKLHKDPTVLARDYSLVKLLAMVRLGRQDMDELDA